MEKKVEKQIHEDPLKEEKEKIIKAKKDVRLLGLYEYINSKTDQDPVILTDFSKFFSDGVNVESNEMDLDKINANKLQNILRQLSKDYYINYKKIESQQVAKEAIQRLLLKTIEKTIEENKDQGFSNIVNKLESITSFIDPPYNLPHNVSLFDGFSNLENADKKRIQDYMDLVKNYLNIMEADSDDIGSLAKFRKICCEKFNIGSDYNQEYVNRVESRIKNLKEDEVFREYRKDSNKVDVEKRFEQMKKGIEFNQGNFISQEQFEAYLKIAMYHKNTDKFKDGEKKAVKWKDIKNKKNFDETIKNIEDKEIINAYEKIKSLPYTLVVDDVTNDCHLVFGGGRGKYSQALNVSKGTYGDVKYSVSLFTGKVHAIKKLLKGRFVESQKIYEEGTGKLYKPLFAKQPDLGQTAKEIEIGREAGSAKGAYEREAKGFKREKFGVKENYKKNYLILEYLPGEDLKDELIDSNKKALSNIYITPIQKQKDKDEIVRSDFGKLLVDASVNVDKLANLKTQASKKNVASKINKEKHIITEEVLNRIKKASDYLNALNDLHAKDIIHGDIKPINYKGGRLFDFDASSKVAEVKNGCKIGKDQIDATVAGTAQWMPPEYVIKGKGISKRQKYMTPVSDKGDIYSAGVSIFGLTDFQAYIQSCKDRGIPTGYHDLDKKLKSYKDKSIKPMEFKKEFEEIKNKYGLIDKEHPKLRIPYTPDEGSGLELYDAIDTLAKIDNKFEPIKEKMVELLEKMTAFNPSDRISVPEALNELRLIQQQFSVLFAASSDKVINLEQELTNKFGSVGNDRLAKMKKTTTSKVAEDLKDVVNIGNGSEKLLMAIVNNYPDDYLPSIKPILEKINTRADVKDLIIGNQRERINRPLIQCILHNKPKIFYALFSQISKSGTLNDLLKDKDHKELLVIAAKHNNYEIFKTIFDECKKSLSEEDLKKLLISKPKDETKLLDVDYNCLEWAIYNKNDELIKYALNKSGLNIADLATSNKSGSIFHFIAHNKSTKQLEIFMDHLRKLNGNEKELYETINSWKDNSNASPLWWMFEDNEDFVSGFLSTKKVSDDFRRNFLTTVQGKSNIPPLLLIAYGNNDKSINALFKYLQSEKEGFKNKLFEVNDDNGNNFVYFLAKNKNLFQLEKLISNYSEEAAKAIISENKIGINALDYLIIDNNPDYINIEEQIFYKFVDCLAKNDIKLEFSKPIDNKNLLYHAVNNSKYEIAKYITGKLSSDELCRQICDKRNIDYEDNNIFHKIFAIDLPKNENAKNFIDSILINKTESLEIGVNIYEKYFEALSSKNNKKESAIEVALNNGNYRYIKDFLKKYAEACSKNDSISCQNDLKRVLIEDKDNKLRDLIIAKIFKEGKNSEQVKNKYKEYLKPTFSNLSVEDKVEFLEKSLEKVKKIGETVEKTTALTDSLIEDLTLAKEEKAKIDAKKLAEDKELKKQEAATKKQEEEVKLQEDEEKARIEKERKEQEEKEKLEIERKADELKRRNEELEKILSKQGKEAEKLNTKTKQQEEKITNLQEKYDKEAIKSKDLKQKLDNLTKELQSQQREYDKERDKYDKERKELIDGHANLLNTIAEADRLHNIQIDELKKSISKLNDQNRKLNEQLDPLKKENKEFFNLVQKLEQQIKELELANEQLVKDRDLLGTEQSKTIEDLNKKINELRSLPAALKEKEDKLEKIQSILQQREQELENLKNKLKDSNNQLKDQTILQEKLDKLNEDLEEFEKTKQELEEVKNRLAQKESNFEAINETLKQKELELKAANEKLEQKELGLHEDLDKLRDKVASLEKEKQNFEQQVQSLTNSYEKQIQNLVDSHALEKENLNNDFDQKVADLINKHELEKNNLEEEVEDLQRKLSSLSESLSNEELQNLQNLDALKTENEKLQKEVASRDHSILKGEEKIKRLEENLTDQNRLKEENDELRARIETLQKQLSDSENKKMTAEQAQAIQTEVELPEVGEKIESSQEDKVNVAKQQKILVKNSQKSQNINPAIRTSFEEKEQKDLKVEQAKIDTDDLPFEKQFILRRLLKINKNKSTDRLSKLQDSDINYDIKNVLQDLFGDNGKGDIEDKFNTSYKKGETGFSGEENKGMVGFSYEHGYKNIKKTYSPEVKEMYEKIYVGDSKEKYRAEKNNSGFSLKKGDKNIAFIHIKGDAITIESATMVPTEITMLLMLEAKRIEAKKTNNPKIEITNCENQPKTALELYLGALAVGLKPELDKKTQKIFHEKLEVFKNQIKQQGEDTLNKKDLKEYRTLIKLQDLEEKKFTPSDMTKLLEEKIARLEKSHPKQKSN